MLLTNGRIDRIADTLLEQLESTLKSINKDELLKSWKELPSPIRSKVYAIDGSRSISRLSGTVIYFLSSFAVGTGKQYRLVYANAMRYNYGVSEQIIRMQMETLENMLGYLAGKKLGREGLVLMDGTLTGSIIRPPVYPKDIESMSILRSILEEDRFDELVTQFIRELTNHYSKVEEELESSGHSDSPLKADESVKRFEKEYLQKTIFGYLRGKVRVKVRIEDFRRKSVPVTVLEKAVENGKSLEKLVDEIRKGEIEIYVSKEDLLDALHVLLTYLEYLYSLDKLLGLPKVAYVAKSFYTRNLAERLGLEVVDTALLDIIMRSILGSEREGYLDLDPIRPKHEIPDYLLKHFKNIEKILSNGINIAYVRFERGDVIYMVQSNRKIEEILPEMLYHKAGGYLRPLQLAHHGVKISYKEAKANLAILINMLRAKNPNLKIFVKYGRAPLE
ncbi:Single-stranded exonuclease associated with Rad50/Mre11 complex [Thermococcus chitonophagus]|nr:Single-stranded exonuclease associated with Rad50/Mre11 complex [Thermococcus chitonophagus]